MKTIEQIKADQGFLDWYSGTMDDDLLLQGYNEYQQSLSAYYHAMQDPEFVQWVEDTYKQPISYWTGSGKQAALENLHTWYQENVTPYGDDSIGIPVDEPSETPPESAPDAQPDYPPLEFYENEAFRQWLTEHYPTIDDSYWWSSGGREALKQLFTYWGNTMGGETTPTPTPSTETPNWVKMQTHQPAPTEYERRQELQARIGQMREELEGKNWTSAALYSSSVRGSGTPLVERWYKDRNSYRDETQPPRPGQPTYPPDTTDRPEGRPYGWRKPRETWW